MGLSKVKDTGVFLIGLSAQSMTDLALDDSFQGSLEDYHSHFIFPQLFLVVKALRNRYGMLELLKFRKDRDTPSLSQISFQERGWQSMRTSHVNEQATMGSYQASYERFKFKNQYLDNVKSIIDRAQQRGIHVGFFYAPTSKFNYQIDMNTGLSGFSLDSVKKELIDAGAVWLDLPSTLYPTFDGDHLDEEHAKIYSSDLASIAKLNFPKLPHPKER